MILLQGAGERVDVLQFSPDGRSLVAPCRAGVQVWNGLAAGSPTTVIAHPGVWSVCFTADGRKLLLVGSPARVALLDVPSGQFAEVPLGWPGQGGYYNLSPDGRFLLAAQVRHGEEPPGLLFCRPLEDLASSVWSAEATRRNCSLPLFLPDAEQFAVVEWGPDRLFVVRDTQTGAVLSEVPAAGDQFHGPVQTADRRLLAFRRGIWAAVFRADDLGAAPVVFRNDNRKEFTGLAFHPSGRFLAATSNDATVKLYDTATWKVAQSFNWDIGRLRSVAFSQDGMLAAAGGDRGKIVVWDVDL
jgi:WD40 repeat protein